MFSIKHCFWWRWEYQVQRLGEIEESHNMDTTKGYLTQRSEVRMALVLSISLLRNLILSDIAENMSKINLTEFLWLILL